MKKLFAKTLVVASIVGAASAQAQEGQWLKGETTRGLQVAGVAGGASSATIGYAHFVDANKSYRFDGGINFTKAAGGGNSFTFSIDAGIRTYVATAGSVKAFTQPGAFLAKGSGAKDFIDNLSIAAQYLVGAEYFVNPNFSFGATTGVALTFSQGFDQISLGTGTSALFATLYW